MPILSSSLILSLLASTGSSTAAATIAEIVAEAADPALSAQGSGLSLSADWGLEYRVSYNDARPLTLNDLTAEKLSYFDQRLRLQNRTRIGSHVSVVATVDVLDGVLFGDNGLLGGSPGRNRGSVIGTKFPNVSTYAVGQLDPNRPTLDPENYGYVLVPAEPVKIRAAYGEALTPVGMIRAGRLPLSEGRGVLTHSGKRINRWGISRDIDVVDGIAFGTKLSAIADVIAGRAIDKSLDRGLFIALLYGKPQTGSPTLSDDLDQAAVKLWWMSGPLGNDDKRRITANLTTSYRRGDLFDTQLVTLSPALTYESERFRFHVEHVHLLGETREIGESLKLLNDAAGEAQLQDLIAFGGLAEVSYQAGPLELIFNLFYASGDDDPSNDSAINQLTFTPDTNVGLHLFENVLHYLSARSAQLGVVNLSALDPESLAVSEVNTFGGMQNAWVLFPQVVYTPLPWLDTRLGVMFAFSDKPVVDPVGSTLNKDGFEIEDDLQNFNGGKPGSYWGTEIDLGVSVRPNPGFQIDLELGYLIPGDALQDENGDAVNSIFTNVRLMYYYDS